MKNYTLTDFMNLDISRKEEIAEIIIDYTLYKGEQKPVRLIGFTSNSNKSDFEIREEGFYYYQKLLSKF
jgi:hypothetical protein